MLKHAERWLPGYLYSLLRRPRRGRQPTHVLFAICDHFEPLSPHAAQPQEVGDRRVARWLRDYPGVASEFRDADGRPPCHTFFYPAEAAEQPHRYVPMLLPLVRAELGEVEIHLHHDHDTPVQLARTLTGFRDWLHAELGLLGTDSEGRPRYGFIHGNWALCNSRPDGRWCGVNEELTILRETGCYADLTMPSGASPTQSRKVNDLYYASNRPGKPNSHARGISVVAGRPDASAKPCPDAGDLMLIQGPLGLNWRWRKWGLLPRFEHADLCASNPPTPQRVDLWVRQHIHVRGRPDWLFVKVHTHGCLEHNLEVLLGEPIRAMHRHLASMYNDGERFCLHYVSAREMYNLAKAAEAGASGNPAAYRDFVIRRPRASGLPDSLSTSLYTDYPPATVHRRDES